MGCGNCSSGASGKPSGCKGNGGCSTGGCNRLNVFDWLSALPLHDGARPYPVIEVSFSNGSRKDFYRNNTNIILEKGDWLAVEGVGGFDIGRVSLTGELVKLQLKKYGVREAEVTRRVLHLATEEELQQSQKQKEREAEVLIRSRAIARSLNLEMKLCEVEIQADSKKGTFFYTADQRVDFRELIRVYATDFKMKVEMKQIGARQESGKVGGIGSCGRELCCSTWLTDFKSVNTTAARYQNLSINQTKLSGQCGRLKCCLNYELDTYMDALSVFPDHVDHLETVKGVAHLQKRDIFKNLMWYSYSDNNKQYPLSIDRVKEIQRINKLGQKADDLQPVELETKESKAGKVDAGFINDVGQITLKNLEKGNKKKKSGGAKPQQGEKPARGNKPPQAAGAPQQGNRPPRAEGAEKPTGQGNRPPREGGGQQSGQQRQNKKPQQQNAGLNAVPGQPKPNQPQRPKGQPGGGQQQPNKRPQQNPTGEPVPDQDRSAQQNRRQQLPATGEQTPGQERPQREQQPRPNRPQRQNRPRPERPQGEENKPPTPDQPVQ
jgi:cell fate regulator YaaT (PSP1 superfamily)